MSNIVTSDLLESSVRYSMQAGYSPSTRSETAQTYRLESLAYPTGDESEFNGNEFNGAELNA